MLVSVVSVKGSPGVTTFAVALASRWPAPARPLVMEADPSGGDLGVRLTLPPSPGLVSLAAATRHSGDPDLMWAHAHRLPGGLSIITAPPDAEHARIALTEFTHHPPSGLTTLRGAARHPGAVVVIDCGRLDSGSPALPITHASDVLIVLSHAHGDALAHLPHRLPTLRAGRPAPMLLLVGPGYPSAEIGRELGVDPPLRVPADPRGAALFCGRSVTARWARSASADTPLGRTARTVALTLATQHPPQRPTAPHEPPQPVYGLPPLVVSPHGLRAVPHLDPPRPEGHRP